MIITIDTEKDRPQQLRKAAEFLLRLAGDAPTSSPTPPAEEPERFEIDEGMLNIFNEPDTDDDEPDTSLDSMGVRTY